MLSDDRSGRRGSLHRSLEVLVVLHRTASRRAPVVAGLAALALITVWGQPAASTATTHQAKAGASAVDSHPYSKAHQRTVRLVKVSRPSDARLKRGQHSVPRHVLPELVPPGRDGGPKARSRAPHVESTKVSRRRSSLLLANFDGVNAIQNAATTGADSEPPDEGLGAGHGFVANFVNTTGAIYNTHGGMVQGPFYLNTFFGEPP